MDFTGFDKNFSLTGKTSLVTGADAGIGETISLMFGRKGADLMLFVVHSINNLLFRRSSAPFRRRMTRTSNRHRFA